MLERIGLVIALVLLVGLGANNLRLSGVQKDLQKEKQEHSQTQGRLESAQADVEILKNSLKTNSELKAEAERVSNDLRNSIQVISARRDELSNRLRSVTSAKATSSPAPTTGAQLREAAKLGDKSILSGAAESTYVLNLYSQTDIDEAERADTIRENLLACYARFDALKEKVEKPM